MSVNQIPEKIVAIEKYEETGILYSDFTDGGATVGTYTCKFTIPAGFNILRATVTNVTGFTNDTSAVITVGDGSDVDRLNAGTPSVFTTISGLDLGVPSGTVVVATAFKPVLTVTTAADFTSVNAGQLDIQVYGYQVY